MNDHSCIRTPIHSVHNRVTTQVANCILRLIVMTNDTYVVHVSVEDGPIAEAEVEGHVWVLHEAYKYRSQRYVHRERKRAINIKNWHIYKFTTTQTCAYNCER